jgi:hypothetical protein
MGLLGDEWRMVRAGRHSIDVFLDLASAMSQDETAAVIDVIAARIELIGRSLLEAGDHPGFAAWVRHRFGPTLARLGLPGTANEDENRLSLRATLLRLVGITGDDPDLQRQARELAQRYMIDRGAIPATVAPEVLHVAAFAGDEILYDAYQARLSTLATEPEEYYRYLNALPWFRDPALVHRTLAYSLTPAVRSQDVASLLGALMALPWSSDAAWAFVRDEWPALTAKLDPFESLPGLAQSMSAFCSSTRADEMEAFFRAHPVPTSQLQLQQQIEAVRSCAELDVRERGTLKRWLAKASTSGTTAAPDPDSLRRPARP